jgi:hypothetical protein
MCKFRNIIRDMLVALVLSLTVIYLPCFLHGTRILGDACRRFEPLVVLFGMVAALMVMALIRVVGFHASGGNNE